MFLLASDTGWSRKCRKKTKHSFLLLQVFETTLWKNCARSSFGFFPSKYGSTFFCLKKVGMKKFGRCYTHQALKGAEKSKLSLGLEFLNIQISCHVGNYKLDFFQPGIHQRRFVQCNYMTIILLA